jgi:hypothetical protein
MNDNNFLSLKFFSVIIKLFITTVVIVLYLHYFIPQSWGFYTIESNIPLYNIYKVHNGIADKVPLIKNNMSYGMGMSREGKILFDELYGIVNNKNLTWKVLIEDSLNSLTLHNKFTRLSSLGKDVTFKGFFLVTKAYRPSYNILRSGEKFRPSQQYIMVEIR